MKPPIEYRRFSPRPRAQQGAGDSEANSIASQADQIARFCALRGLSKARIVINDEYVSARTTPLAEREGGKELCRLVRAGHKQIIVTHIDRLFRDEVDGMNTLLDWNRKDVFLWMCNGVALDVGTAIGRLIASMLLSVSAFEPRMTAERTAHAMKAHQSNGKRMSRHIPYGKRLDTSKTKLSKDKSKQVPYILVEDADEQRNIRIVQGYNHAGLGHREIARKMNEAGIAYRGGRWYHSQVGAILRREG